MFAVADALDALTTDRPYRPASSFAAAREEVYAGSGTQFDPAVVAAYREIPDSTFEALRDAALMNRTILIVDDDAGIRRLIATTLEDVSGYRHVGGRRRRRRPSSAPARCSPRSSSWTSTCRGWTGSRPAGG